MEKTLFLVSLFLFPLSAFASPVYTVYNCETTIVNGDYSLAAEKWNNGDHEVPVYENSNGIKLYFSGVSRWTLSSVLSNGDDNYYYGNTHRLEDSPLTPPEIYLPQLGVGSSCAVLTYGSPAPAAPVAQTQNNEPSSGKNPDSGIAAAGMNVPSSSTMVGGALVLLSVLVAVGFGVQRLLKSKKQGEKPQEGA